MYKALARFSARENVNIETWGQRFTSSEKNEYMYMISVIRHLRNKCILHLNLYSCNSYHEIETNRPVLIDGILFCYALL